MNSLTELERENIYIKINMGSNEFNYWILRNILKDNGIIVLHRHKKNQENFGKNFIVKRTSKYGISKIIFGKFI